MSSTLSRLERVDLLKLDIEGAETAVLLEAERDLARVDRIMVEYHSFVDRPQALDELPALLRRQSFRVYIETQTRAVRPFLGIQNDRGIDNRCDIYAWRC